MYEEGGEVKGEYKWKETCKVKITTKQCKIIEHYLAIGSLTHGCMRRILIKVGLKCGVQIQPEHIVFTFVQLTLKK